jgi:NADH-quinone oxidoreductase subunit J
MGNPGATGIPLPIDQAWVFYLVAAFILVCAVAVVAIPNVIHSALALGACFMGIAALYILLHAQFLAVAQVLIYVGDVTVLILFALMLTRGLTEPHLEKWGMPVAGGVLIGLLVAALSIDSIGEATRAAVNSFASRVPGIPLQTLGSYGIVRVFSRQMLTTYLLPFEVASGILLMALVGAVVLAREDRPDDAA